MNSYLSLNVGDNKKLKHVTREVHDEDYITKTRIKARMSRYKKPGSVSDVSAAILELLYSKIKKGKIS